ncbi:MAG TPA: agmatinase [Candidatus Paceibacterota bacterium]
MSKWEVFVLSKHLSLESLDTSTGIRVVMNTLTSQRLQITCESMKILDAFQIPRTLFSAARELGVTGKGSQRQLRSLLTPLIDASFLVSASDVMAHEQRNLRTIIESDSFVRPKTLFAHCPSVNMAEIEQGTVVIAGIGSDQATTGDPGTRHGPERLREVSTRFITYDRDIFTLTNRGWYNADIGKVILHGIPFADVGNVAHHLSEDSHHFYERCYRAALAIHERKAFPVFIGGDHSISAPLIRACEKAHEDITLIHFDAHTDLAEWDYSVSHHHGNVMSRVLHENPKLEIHQFGIRGFAGAPPDNNRCHVVRQREIDTDLDEVISLRIPQGCTCYISFDVDVIDPSFAPGTGTPVSMGMTPNALLRLMEAVAQKNHVVGIDIVELCPCLDRNDMTANLVFHVLMCLLSWTHESR